MESVELTPKEARKLIDAVVRDHKRAALRRDRLDKCTNTRMVRAILIEAGIPRSDVDATLDAERRRRQRRRRARRRRPYVAFLFLLGLGFVTFCVARWVAPRYDALISQREDVRREWAQTDALLQRRYDLIPNLVEVVGGFAGHEAAVLTEIADAHSGYVKARSMDARLQASYEAERAIRTCALLGARYPELKSDRTFSRLMDELTRTEDAITQQRMKYNEAVGVLNAEVQTTRGRVVSALTGISLAAYYNPPAGSEALPVVDFHQSEAEVHVRAALAQAGAPPLVEAEPDIAAVRLTAVGGRGRKRRATILLPDGTSTVVGLGDRIEPLAGRVVAVNPRSILVETDRVATTGASVTQNIRLSLGQ